MGRPASFVTTRLDALPEQYWATGNVRNNAIATELNRQVPNPFHISNFESMRTSDPLLYQHMSTLGPVHQPDDREEPPAAAVPAHERLDRQRPDPAGKARTHALELNFQRRMSQRASTLNASYTRMLQENNTIPRERIRHGADDLVAQQHRAAAPLHRHRHLRAAVRQGPGLPAERRPESHSRRLADRRDL